MRSCPKCGYEYVYAEDTSCRKCGCQFDKSGEPIEAAPIETKTEPPKYELQRESNVNSFLFNEVGHKIRMLAKIGFWISCIAYFVLAIILFTQAADSWYNEEMYIILGVVSLVVGPLISWISTLILYGFGELIENTYHISRK